jgi:DNA uptake protein ComE-like DNA-binding protein
MPTPSEQKALAFVAIVVVLGGAARIVSAGAAPVPTPMEQQALARQASAAESAAAASRPRRTASRGRGAKKGREQGVKVIGGLAGAPARFDRSGLLTTEAGNNGFPPPLPRIDSDQQPPPGTSITRSQRGAPPGAASPVPAIDLDRASEAEIERLPRVGPALARRIVASRDSFGPFGSLEALGRVKGVGPATLQLLSASVTFSGRASSRP